MTAEPLLQESGPEQEGRARPTRIALGPDLLAIALVFSCAAAIVSLHVFSIFGVVPGAELLAVATLGGLSLIPRWQGAGAPERRVVVGTAAATATTVAALALTLPLGLVSAAGRTELTASVMLGAALAGAVALVSLVWLFDSPLLPAAAPWPPGQAAAERSNRRLDTARALSLLAGLGLGHWGAGTFVAPLLSAFGLAFLGNAFGLSVLGVGLVVRPSLPYLLRADLNGLYVPHGLLVGAGLAALAQATYGALAQAVRPSGPPGGRSQAVRRRRSISRTLRRAVTALAGEGPAARRLLVGLSIAVLAYAVVGLAVFLVSSAELGLRPPGVGLAALAALLALGFQLFGALVASRAGWVPALGGGLAVVAFSARIGLSPPTDLVLTALILAAGPVSAELGYQLKAGHALGLASLRAQQVLTGLLGLCVALVVVGVGHGAYFERGFVPPAAAVLASVVDLSQQAGGLAGITPWILAGALVQWLGGAGRQVGVLLATGLLIDNSAAGWAILAGLTARTLLGGALRGRADRSLAIFGLGCIAGDMLHTALGD